MKIMVPLQSSLLVMAMPKLFNSIVAPQTHKRKEGKRGAQQGEYKKKKAFQKAQRIKELSRKERSRT